jgi:hypothetical protein
MDWEGLRQDVIDRVIYDPEDDWIRQEINALQQESVRLLLQKAMWDPFHEIYHRNKERSNETKALELSSSAWVDDEVTNHLHQYTIVGLAQRKSRQWLNLPEILQHCYDKFLSRKIICIEINLDNRETKHNKYLSSLLKHPYKDAVLHAGLDVLIGIHGSQQTNAVYMPQGAFMLELLPHLYGEWGTWTIVTTEPTCNGLMTHGTSLQHIGHPLPPTSGADCHGCFGNDPSCTNATIWNKNDFVVHWHVVDDFLETFILGHAPRQRNRKGHLVVKKEEEVDAKAKGGHGEYRPLKASRVNRTCGFFEQRSHQDFVLYNVNCLSHKDTWEHRHYYRERSSFTHLNIQL